MKELMLIGIVMHVINLQAQINLVPNPSFEDTVSCPDWPQPTIEDALNWHSFYETSDYFNICGNPQFWGSPQNVVGYQLPYNGNGYAGLIGWQISPISPTREFIGSELINPLVVGEKYYLSFYISNADSDLYNSSCNNLGIKFSTVSYSYSVSPSLDNFAHLKTDSIITNKTSWSRISGSFYADSSYRYIMFGNFFDDNNTLADTAPSHPQGAYYYVDAICVTTDSIYNSTWISVNEIKPKDDLLIFPNPANSIMQIRNDDERIDGVIFNSIGQTISNIQVLHGLNKYDVSLFSEGIYFIRLNNNNYKKIIIYH